MIENLPPITGTFPKDDTNDVRDIPPHEGFNEAWRDVLDQAAEAWHEKGADPIEVPVKVELFARIDIWNPGGIGQYHVKVTPTG
jgi:hypothetical protein